MPLSSGINKGEVYGRLIVLGESSERTKAQKRKFKCLCRCGNIVTVIGAELKNEHVQSCGCLRLEKITHHGHSGKNRSPTYQTWQAMLERCYNENAIHYNRYGGRGIRVCYQWHTFSNFLKDMGERPTRTTLDRIDNDGDYSPSNCRWATGVVQARNSRKFNRKQIEEILADKRSYHAIARSYHVSQPTISKIKKGETLYARL